MRRQMRGDKSKSNSNLERQLEQEIHGSATKSDSKHEEVKYNSNAPVINGKGNIKSIVAGSESNMEPMATNGSAASTNDVSAKPRVLVEAINRESIYINEKNRSTIESFKSSGDWYQAFEASIPLQLIEYREFEGRIKKLVYGRNTISIR